MRHHAIAIIALLLALTACTRDGQRSHGLHYSEEHPLVFLADKEFAPYEYQDDKLRSRGMHIELVEKNTEEPRHSIRNTARGLLKTHQRLHERTGRPHHRRHRGVRWRRRLLRLQCSELLLARLHRKARHRRRELARTTAARRHHRSEAARLRPHLSHPKAVPTRKSGAVHAALRP